MRIRDARLDEVGALEALQRRASLVWEDYREQLLANPDAIQLPVDHVGLTRVAVDHAGARLGFAVVLGVLAGACELDGLFVEPDAWGRGVGRALVDDAAGRARAGGAEQLEVIANPRAVGFYERVAFVPAGTASTRFGPAQRMRRRLG